MNNLELADALQAAWHSKNAIHDIGRLAGDNITVLLALLRQQEQITAVAIKHDGATWMLLPPARHHDIIARIRDVAPETLPVGGGGSAQGFMTSLGRFVEREEAGQIALAAKQTPALKWGPSLFSEDLW